MKSSPSPSTSLLGPTAVKPTMRPSASATATPPDAIDCPAIACRRETSIAASRSAPEDVLVCALPGARVHRRDGRGVVGTRGPDVHAGYLPAFEETNWETAEI